jgi:hypothetical protein
MAPSAILQDVVRAYPGYDLEVGNGVVHVFPAAMRGDRADILKSRIASFEVKDQFVAFAPYLLAGKVKPLMVPPDPKVRGGQGFSISSGSGDKKVTPALLYGPLLIVAAEEPSVPFSHYQRGCG